MSFLWKIKLAVTIRYSLGCQYFLRHLLVIASLFRFGVIRNEFQSSNNYSSYDMFSLSRANIE